MSQRERAWLLSYEHECEHCKERPAVVFFDRMQVCARCRQLLERQLVREEGT